MALDNVDVVSVSGYSIKPFINVVMLDGEVRERDGNGESVRELCDRVEGRGLTAHVSRKVWPLELFTYNDDSAESNVWHGKHWRGPGMSHVEGGKGVSISNVMGSFWLCGCRSGVGRWCDGWEFIGAGRWKWE